jgi:hypothetical protein
MKYLLFLLAAPAMAAPLDYLTYTNDISVQTVLTQERPSWCHGMKMAFDIDGLNRAYYGCWAGSQGFVHIEMLDGSKRIIPMAKFTKMKEDTK